MLLAYAPVWSAEWIYEDTRWVGWRDGGFSWASLVGSYRVLGLLSWVNIAIGGLSPRSFHLGNVALHLLNGLLLATLTGWRVPRLTLPTVGLFWLHPLQAESVAYVTGRSELAVVTGLLVGLLALQARTPVVDRRDPDLWRMLLVTAAGVWCMAAKSAGITGPLILVAFGALTERSWRSLAIPLGIWAALVLVASPHLLALWRDQYAAQADTSPVRYAAQQGLAVARYLGMVFLPVGQSFDHDSTQLGWAGLGLVGWLALWASCPGSRGWLVVLAAWIVLAVAPRLIMRTPEILNEHQFAVPFVGVALILGVIWEGETA